MGRYWSRNLPKLFTCLNEGYSLAAARRDTLAGLTVAIVALPLAMALGIASGVSPDRGLYTAIIAGFLISFLGGSRFQIGGPTGAFVVIVFDIVQRHGYDGLAMATIMAGGMLIAFGLAGLGSVIKYIPHPLVTGFTSGIAVIIFSSQVKDFLGLQVAEVPAEFVDKWVSIGAHLDSLHGPTLAIGAVALAIIVGLRRYRPSWPGFLIAIVVSSLAVWALGLPVETIGSRFGGIPSTLPSPELPTFSLAKAKELLMPAFTIALLAGIESLLSAMVADGMTGRRHRSNTELVAQGAANIGSILFGGIPATGAIARTATSIRTGARTPVAGIAHALFVMLFMLVFAPLASWIPLSSLAAVLMVVAWNMSEAPQFRRLLSAPKSDVTVLLLTFSLTVLVDLTIGIEVGMVAAALLFMKRMSDVTKVESGVHLIFDEPREGEGDRVGVVPTQPVPEGVAVFQISGPFFFGVATKLRDVLDRIETTPRVFILRMRLVPVIDATGAHALSEMLRDARQRGTQLILSGVQPQPLAVLRQMGLEHAEGLHLAEGIDAALVLAGQLVGQPPAEGGGREGKVAGPAAEARL